MKNNEVYEGFNMQYIYVNANNEVVINKETFENIVKQAFIDGFNKGINNNCKYCITNVTNPNYTIPCTITASNTKSYNNIPKNTINNTSEYEFPTDKKINNQSVDFYLTKDSEEKEKLSH